MKKKTKRLIKNLESTNQILTQKAVTLTNENNFLRNEITAISEALVSVIVADLTDSVNATPLSVKNVKFDPPYTTVYFEDGTESAAKCHSNDTFSKEAGFSVALAKKVYGDKFYDYIDKFCK